MLFRSFLLTHSRHPGLGEKRTSTDSHLNKKVLDARRSNGDKSCRGTWIITLQAKRYPLSVAYYVTYLVPSLERRTAIFNLCREMEAAGRNINTDFGKYHTSLTGKSQMYFNVHYLI